MCHLENKKQYKNPLLNLMRLNVLNNIFVKFMVHHIQIYKKHLKDFNEEEKLLKYFSFYNLFDVYETKVKRKVWFISLFFYTRDYI